MLICVHACALNVLSPQLDFFVGRPGNITDLTIPPDLITSASFVAQWSEPSSDPVCGTVQYIVTVYTGGIVISNDTINQTTYVAMVYRANTNYAVNLTAYNAAGISASTAKQVVTTNSDGKHTCCAYNRCTYICNIKKIIHAHYSEYDVGVHALHCIMQSIIVRL